MNYEAIYGRLIGRAKTRTLTGYCEVHHIIPRCMGGEDRPNNLVKLTPEEHFVAHQLLVKIYPDNYKLVCAAKMMAMGENPGRCNKVRGNKLYGWLRKRFSKLHPAKRPEVAEKIRQSRLGKSLSAESIEKREKTRKERNIPNPNSQSKLKGRKRPPELMAKIRAKLTGQKRTQEAKEKMRQAKLGKKNPNNSKPRSEEARKNMAIAQQRRWQFGNGKTKEIKSCQ